MGRRLEAMYPQVPLAARQALGIAIMSYDGHLYFGLLGDFDAMPDLEETADDLAASIEELAAVAGVQPSADDEPAGPAAGVRDAQGPRVHQPLAPALARSGRRHLRWPAASARPAGPAGPAASWSQWRSPWPRWSGWWRSWSSRDDPDLAPAGQAGPGQLLPDRGARHLPPGQRAPAGAGSAPPTSGPHVPMAVRRTGAPLSDDQLLHAVELGNVVILHAPGQDQDDLLGLAEQIAGPFDPTLAATGQAVIVAPRPGVRGVVAVGWRRRQAASSAADPALRRFVESYLGRGRR